MKVLVIFLLSVVLQEYALASECYRPYIYSNEATFVSSKITGGSRNQIDGVLHVRTRIGDDGKLKEVMYFFDAKKLAVSVSGDVSDMEKSIAYPVKVRYQKDGLPEKAFFLDGDKNPVLTGIVRDLIYVKQSGYFEFEFDEVDSRYQVEVKDQSMMLVPLDVASSLASTSFIKSDYQVALSKDSCTFFNKAESSREMIQTSKLVVGDVSVKSTFTAVLDHDAVLPADHWFMKLRFDDDLWSSPKFKIKSDLPENEAKKRIALLVESFRTHLDDENFLESLINKRDNWLIYFSEFLEENDLDEETSKKLFLMLGKLNTRLSVDVLNRVARNTAVHEDHRFRAVAALMTTDAAISEDGLNAIRSLVGDQLFINNDVSTKAYIMSLGLVAASREETAPGQTSEIRRALVGQLYSPDGSLVPVINAVGNLGGSADEQVIASLETIATSTASEHQKASSISSLARLENTNLSLDQIQNQFSVSDSPSIQKEWLGLAASSKTVDKHSAKLLLLSVAENPKTDSTVRDAAVIDMTEKLPMVLDTVDKDRLRKLLPSVQSKEAKASIYKVLVK